MSIFFANNEFWKMDRPGNPRADDVLEVQKQYPTHSAPFKTLLSMSVLRNEPLYTLRSYAHYPIRAALLWHKDDEEGRAWNEFSSNVILLPSHDAIVYFCKEAMARHKGQWLTDAEWAVEYRQGAEAARSNWVPDNLKLAGAYNPVSRLHGAIKR